jgi:tRNA dimethylallyltransferase
MSASTAASSAVPSAAEAGARPRVGFIVGPTGVGKTGFAIKLAERLDAEIINADSRQIFRGMDIGTAKPTAAERARVTHHLVDRLEPDYPLNAADFAQMAHAAIDDVVARGKRPLVVGGSGLYLRVLRGGIFASPAAAPGLRAELAAQAEREGSSQMHRRLGEVDPAAAARIHPNDLKRIVRALEVFELSGTPISRHQRSHGFASFAFECLTIGLEIPRPELYAEIDRRFDAMMAAGLVEEVRALMIAGIDSVAAGLSTIGYRELAAYLRGEITLESAVETAKRESRRLAKRQLTWFRADPATVWIDPRDGTGRAAELLEDFFKQGRADG